MVLFVCAAYVYFVDGVRGSDQFWYMADTETLASGLPPLTNTVFPGDVLRAGTPDIDTYFAHNGPLLYINAQVAQFTGAFYAWKYTNLLFFLLAALFTGLTLAFLTNVAWGLVGVIVYLLTPINVWLAGNFLQETFFGLLSAAVLYACVTDEGGRIKRVLLLSALFIGSLSHPLYVIVGVFYSIYGLTVCRVWVMPVLATGSVVVASVLKGIWFPTSFPPTIKDLIVSTAPGVTNSIWQLSDEVPRITLEFIFGKFLHALQIQFIPSVESPLFLVTNVGFIALMLLFFKRHHRDWKFLYISTIFMLSYGGMIALMQNQVRYQLFISSVAICCTLAWLSGWKRENLRAGVIIVVLTLYCIIDVRMFQKIQIEGREGRQGLLVFERQFEFIEPEARVALLGNTLGGWLSVISALRPVDAMPIFRSVLNDESFNKVMNIYSPDYLFTREGYLLDELPGAEYITTVENPELFNVMIYRWKNSE